MDNRWESKQYFLPIDVKRNLKFVFFRMRCAISKSSCWLRVC